MTSTQTTDWFTNTASTKNRPQNAITIRLASDSRFLLRCLNVHRFSQRVRRHRIFRHYLRFPRFHFAVHLLVDCGVAEVQELRLAAVQVRAWTGIANHSFDVRPALREGDDEQRRRRRTLRGPHRGDNYARLPRIFHAEFHRMARRQEALLVRAPAQLDDVEKLDILGAGARRRDDAGRGLAKTRQEGHGERIAKNRRAARVAVEARRTSRTRQPVVAP